MWFRLRRARGLLAASLYEEVTEAERAFLSRELGRNAGLRGELCALEELVRAIPGDAPELGVDLAPAVRRRLVEGARPRRARAFRYAVAGAVAAVALVAASYAWLGQRHSGFPSGVLVAHHVSEEDPLVQALASAARLREQGNFTGAFHALKMAVEQHRGDARAGEAQLALASLAYEELHWYAEADAAYETYIREFTSAFGASPYRAEAWERHELLAEGRAFSYASLQELDAARQDRSGSLAPFEALIARYPKTLAASRATLDMARRVAQPGEDIGSGARLASALKEARDRCVNPIAVAQLNVELGHVYRTRLLDAANARALYREAAQCPEVASLAKASLEGLGPE